MTEVLKLFVDPLDIESCIVALQRIDGVKVQLETRGLTAPEPKTHDQYSFEFAALVPIIISVTGMITSFTALATVLVQLKSQAKINETKDAKPMVIVVGDKKI